MGKFLKGRPMSHRLWAYVLKAHSVRLAASIVACLALVALSLTAAARSAHAQSSPETLPNLSVSSADCTSSAGVYSCSSPTVTLSGTGADPSTNVVVADSNGYWLGETTSNSTGAWSLPVTLLANSSSYTLDAFEVNGSTTQPEQGSPSPTVSVTVTGNQLLTNGSFEQPSVASVSGGNNNWLYFFTPDQVAAGYAVAPYSTTPVPGWASTNPQCGIELQSASTIPVQPYDGAQYTELASNCVSGVTQTISTVPGTQYSLSFAFQARPAADLESQPVENTMSVEWGGQTVAPSLQGGSTWQVYTYVLTATSTSTVLQFERHQPGRRGHLRRLPRRRLGGPDRFAGTIQHLLE